MEARVEVDRAEVVAQHPAVDPLVLGPGHVEGRQQVGGDCLRAADLVSVVDHRAESGDGEREEAARLALVAVLAPQEPRDHCHRQQGDEEGDGAHHAVCPARDASAPAGKRINRY